MTAQPPTAADLAARAAEELREGLPTAWVPALVAIALALTGARPTPDSDSAPPASTESDERPQNDHADADGGLR